MITLHRYSPTPAPGDLTRADLAVLWGLMLDEALVETFFHDGTVRGLAGFVEYATSPGNWFYAVRRGGEFLGFGGANNFTSNGNTAFAHLCSFACGRDGSFAEAARMWFRLLRDSGGIDTLIAVLPGCYRGARRFTEAAGFQFRMTLPGALRLVRSKGDRVTDACVYQLNTREV